MRRLVYVSGRLGAGKTRSLAFPLAAELGYSLVTKDLVEWTLYDALHVPGEGEIDRAVVTGHDSCSWPGDLPRPAFCPDCAGRRLRLLSLGAAPPGQPSPSGR